MVKKKFIDPEDGKEFTSRNLAKKHMHKKGHRGAVIVEEVIVIEKPKKGTSAIAMSGKKGKNTRGQTVKQRKMQMAGMLYEGYLEDGDSRTQALKKVSNKLEEPERLIIAWLQTLKGEQKNNVKVTKAPVEGKEEEPEEKELIIKPKNFTKWIRIMPQYVDVLKPHLEEGMEIQINPENNNAIFKYLHLQSGVVDYWMFHYNFTGVDLENSDILYILHQIGPTNEFKVWDSAEMEVWGLEDVSEDGCLLVNEDSKLSLSSSVIMGRLGDVPLDKLGCVAGTFVDDSKSLTSISPEHFQFASEEEDYLGYNYGYSRQATTYKPKPKPKFVKYPIYMMSDNYIGTNRLINYDVYE